MLVNVAYILSLLFLIKPIVKFPKNKVFLFRNSVDGEDLKDPLVILSAVYLVVTILVTGIYASERQTAVRTFQMHTEQKILLNAIDKTKIDSVYYLTFLARNAIVEKEYSELDTTSLNIPDFLSTASYYIPVGWNLAQFYKLRDLSSVAILLLSTVFLYRYITAVKYFIPTLRTSNTLKHLIAKETLVCKIHWNIAEWEEGDAVQINSNYVYNTDFDTRRTYFFNYSTDNLIYLSGVSQGFPPEVIAYNLTWRKDRRVTAIDNASRAKTVYSGVLAESEQRFLRHYLTKPENVQNPNIPAFLNYDPDHL